MNNCETPLKLKWDTLTNQYKVNKPGSQDGLYVSKNIADQLLTALIDLKVRCEHEDPEFNLPQVNEAIINATKG